MARMNNIEDMTIVEQLERIKYQICDGYCKYPYQCEGQKELDTICKSCPLNRIGSNR